MNIFRFAHESNTLQIICNIFYFQMDLADSRNPVRHIFSWIAILLNFSAWLGLEPLKIYIQTWAMHDCSF